MDTTGDVCFVLCHLVSNFGSARVDPSRVSCERRAIYGGAHGEMLVMSRWEARAFKLKGETGRQDLFRATPALELIRYVVSRQATKGADGWSGSRREEGPRVSTLSCQKKMRLKRLSVTCSSVGSTAAAQQHKLWRKTLCGSAGKRGIQEAAVQPRCIFTTVGEICWTWRRSCIRWSGRRA